MCVHITHGHLTFGENTDVTVVLDGLDGTLSYKDGRESGTIFSILSGIDPLYKDTIFAGIMLYPNGELYYVSENGIPLVIKNGKKTRIRTSNRTVFDGSCSVIVDTLFYKIF